jgi:transcriptional regulator with XRE-family HTH domain
MLEFEAARTLAERLRLIRVEHYGETGAEVLSARLGIPPKTWANYESGVTPAAPVLLRLIQVTGVHPLWLLDGREPRQLVAGRD